MCSRRELGEMHTLIERPPGQRKYLGENENFISGRFYEALLTQTIKRSTSKHHGKLTVSNTAGSRLGWRRF